ncbi:MAG: oxidoreductase [Elusimicrobia bacterium CG08_land_8_20_14_0_20_44_26]|nr:MAG: oxidoreductase [Elusimicrobia bacterium CG08_land_8_20_14_0_20_44_26]
MTADIYKTMKANVEAVVDETPLIKTFVLKTEEAFSFQTGQFIQFTVPGEGEAPFTPSSSQFQKEYFETTIMKAGRVTGIIHSLKENDTVGIRGPLGKGYPLKEFESREILILGGGVGMAPLRSLLLTLLDEKDKYGRIVLLYGAKNPVDIVYSGQFAGWKKRGAEIYRSVDKCETDQWKEKIGVVTELFDEVKLNPSKGIAVVCGPPVMMKFGTFKLLEIGYKPENIYLSMEKNMSCGLGKCGHCALGKYFACKDGPVFKYSLIKDIGDIWD